MASPYRKDQMEAVITLIAMVIKPTLKGQNVIAKPIYAHVLLNRYKELSSTFVSVLYVEPSPKQKHLPK